MLGLCAVTGQGSELDMAKWAASYYGSNVIMGFNEPDRVEGSNMAVGAHRYFYSKCQ